MRRILIDSRIEKIALEYSLNLFKTRNKGFSMPIDNLKDLENMFLSEKDNMCDDWRDYAEYVQNIIDHYSNLLVLPPSKFESYKVSYFNMLSNTQLVSTHWRQNSRTPFFEEIVKRMRYDAVRDQEYVKYYNKLAIKTCVYCNAQYAVSVNTSSSVSKCYFELDHFKPKSKYPFLCTSFFNLQPCCGNCNRIKLNQNAEFSLYTESSSDIDPFHFRLTDSSVVKYMISQDAKYLETRLCSNNTSLLDNHTSIFHTNELYANFNDIVEEIIWKSKTRDDVYISQLIQEFCQLFPYKKADIIRFLYGTYSKESEVHLRPLTKLKQDICKQLNVFVPEKE